MGQNYYDDQWQTWHEGPPGRDNRWLLILGIGLGVIVLVALCGAGYWFVVRPLLAEPTAVAAPPIPTVLGGEQTATAGAASPTQQPAEQGTSAPGATAEPAETAPPEPTAAPQADFGVPRLATAPAIDGSLDEWGSGPTIVSAYRVHAAQGWDGSADLEATWRVGWDDSAFYIGVTVVDDEHVQTQTGNQIFRGDSLDIQVDTNPAAGATQVNPSTFQVIFSPGNFSDLPPSAFRFQGTSGGRILDATGHNIQVDAAQTGNGYVLEAAIPWGDLNVSAGEGVMLGIALNANDNDRPGEAVQEVMMSSSASRTLTNPQSWGLMVLE